MAERTAALLRIGAAVLDAYDRRKRYAAALDFDDLIACSRRLLERTGMAAWVQYKLDQQIDHLLVDEGQDTSPEQWAIIEALCAEFFTGAGARPLQRTLFVVGDEKQSIMSVQGADVATYRRFREIFENRAPGCPPPLARRAARPVLPLGQADPGPGRRHLRRSGGGGRRGQRRRLAGPRMLSDHRRPAWSSSGP